MRPSFSVAVFVGILGVSVPRAVSHPEPLPSDARGPATVEVVFRDGVHQTVTLVGIGCTESICSTSKIQVRGANDTEHISFDNLASIAVTRPDLAVLTMVDGSARAVSIAPFNRVLYTVTASGDTEQLDLGRTASVTFERARPAALAHHSAVAFDLTKTFAWRGTLTQVDWRNPHVVVSVAVKGDGDTLETWDLETGAPAWFRGRNLTRANLDKAIGQPVGVEGVQAKDGSRYGYLYRLTFADGQSWDLR